MLKENTIIKTMNKNQWRNINVCHLPLYNDTQISASLGIKCASKYEYHT